MPNWVVATLQNSRIKALLLEVKWDFERSELDRLARILIGAQVLRLEVVDPEPSLRAVLGNPFGHDRDHLMNAYAQLEDARNLTAAKAKEIEAQTRRMGLTIPEVVRHRTDESKRSLEVWMATIGSAVAKNGRDHATVIWGKLREARGHVPKALQQLRKVEQELGEAMLGISDEGVVDACRYVPTPYEQK